MDEVMSAHRIDTQPGRQAALVGIRYFCERSDQSVLDRRQIGALCNLCRDAEADLMEAPRQMGGHPVTLWNAIGRRGHSPNTRIFQLISKLINNNGKTRADSPANPPGAMR
jgi:hypothetical protein